MREGAAGPQGRSNQCAARARAARARCAPRRARAAERAHIGSTTLGRRYYTSILFLRGIKIIKTNENKNVFTLTPQPNRTADHPAKRKRSPAPGSPPPSRCCCSTGSP